jgi:tetratricopeptide (TPR) repeat protein
MTEHTPETQEAYAARRASEERALRDGLQALAGEEDRASLERRYALHTELVWYVYQPETTRGQEHARQAVALARQLQDPHREAEALHLLGRAYLAEHPDPTMEESRIGQNFHEEALRLREQLLGPDHPDVAESLLAIVGQGRLWWPIEPYVAMAERAVGICEAAFGPDHERTCGALELLAFMLRTASANDRSLAIYERLHKIYERSYGPEDQRTRNALAQIAWTHQALGNYAEAVALMRDPAAQPASPFGDNLEPLYRRVEISDLLWEQGERAAAEAELSGLLAEVEVAHGAEHPTTLAVMSRVATAFQARGELAQARSLYERVIAGYERLGGHDDALWHDRTALFTVLWREGNLTGAEELFEQLLAPAPNVASLAANLRAMGFLDVTEGSGDPAERNALLMTLYERLLEASERAYGPEHPETAAALLALARQLLDSTGDIPAALPLLYRALAITPRALASPDEELLTLIRSIDGTLSEDGSYAAVREIYQQVLARCEPHLGPAHPQIEALRFRLGMLPERA